jgi:hypothetical protein
MVHKLSEILSFPKTCVYFEITVRMKTKGNESQILCVFHYFHCSVSCVCTILPNTTIKGLNRRIKPHRKKCWTKINSFEIELKQFGSWLTVWFSSIHFNGSVRFSEKLVIVWFKTIKPNHINSSGRFGSKDKQFISVQLLWILKTIQFKFNYYLVKSLELELFITSKLTLNQSK